MKFIDTLNVEGRFPSSTYFTFVDNWNMVGFPQKDNMPVNVTFANIKSNIDSIFTYDSSKEEWLSFSPSGPIFLNTLNEIKPNFGYWVNSKGSINCTFQNGVFI